MSAIPQRPRELLAAAVRILAWSRELGEGPFTAEQEQAAAAAAEQHEIALAAAARRYIASLQPAEAAGERADDLRALEDALILACVADGLDLPGDYTIDDLLTRGLVFSSQDHTDEWTSGLTNEGDAWLLSQLERLSGRLLA